MDAGGLHRLQRRILESERFLALRIRKIRQAVRRRCHIEGRVSSRQISLLHETAGAVQRNESRQLLACCPFRLQFQRDDRTDIRRDLSRRARRTARNLRPGLKQRMHERRRHATANDRDAIQLCGDCGKQPFGKINAVDGRWPEILRRPRANSQIECIGLARRPRQQNENDILSGFEERWLTLINRVLREKTLRRNKVPGDAEPGGLKEYAAIDNHINN